MLLTMPSPTQPCPPYAASDPITCDLCMGFLSCQIATLISHLLDTSFDRDRRLLENLLEGDSNSLMYCLLNALQLKVSDCPLSHHAVDLCCMLQQPLSTCVGRQQLTNTYGTAARRAPAHAQVAWAGAPAFAEWSFGKRAGSGLEMDPCFIMGEMRLGLAHSDPHYRPNRRRSNGGTDSTSFGLSQSGALHTHRVHKPHITIQTTACGAHLYDQFLCGDTSFACVSWPK